MSTETYVTLTEKEIAQVEEYRLHLRPLKDDPTKQAEIDDKFLEALRSSKYQTSLSEEIRHLRRTIAEITASFQKVSKDLHSLNSAEHLPDDEHQKIVQLREKWVQYQTRFEEILEVSRQNAIAAAMMMRQYVNILGEVKDESAIQDLKAELSEFIHRLNEKIPAAVNAQNDFTTLANDVSVFTAMIDDTLRNIGLEIPERIRELEEELDVLNGQLKSIATQKWCWGIAFAAGMAVGAVSAAVACFFLSPIAAGVALGAIVGGTAAGTQLTRVLRRESEVKEQIRECTEKLAHLQEAKQLVEQFATTLEDTKKEVENLSAKIHTIVSVWKILKSDMVALRESIDLAIMGNGTRFFTTKLAIPREIYTRLAASLMLYATDAAL